MKKNNANTQNIMTYPEFLRRIADQIDKSAPKNVRDMNSLVSSVVKSMENPHEFVFKNRLVKAFAPLNAFYYKNWNVFIGEKSFELRCAKYNFRPADYGSRIFDKKLVGFAESSKSVYMVFEGNKGGLYLSRIIK